MKKLIINNGKALADSTGKVLAIESDVTITSKGGWQGTPVPNTGYVENVYFNTNLSIDEVVSLLNSLTLNMDGMGEYLFANIEIGIIIAVQKMSDTTWSIVKISSENEILFISSSDDLDLGFVGWNPDITYPIILNSNANDIIIDEENNMSCIVGSQNAQLSTLFSKTPFVQASGESIGLSGEYDGSPIEASESVDMKALIENKKIPLLINVKGGNSVIEVEEFPTENVQDLTFYKKTKTNNPAIYAVMDGVVTDFEVYCEIIGGSCNITFVEELPNNMEITSMVSKVFNVYIFDGICYINLDVDGNIMQMTLGEFLEVENKGYVDNINGVIEIGVYVVKGGTETLVGVNNATYNYENGVWNNNTDNLIKVLDGSIKSLDLPNVTFIRRYGFYLCASLEYVNLPDTIKLDPDVFNVCMYLKTVKLPKVTMIGSGCFMQCQQLTDLYLGSNQVVQLEGYNAFQLCPNTKVHVRAELLSAYQADTNWAEAVTKGYITLVGDYTD